MDTMDQQVLRQLQHWLDAGQSCFLCTIVGTVGSSPRPVGSLLACNDQGQLVGSLSGGCVEENLLERLGRGELAQQQPEAVEYGVVAEENERLGLPCGGRLTILVERIRADQQPGMNQVIADGNHIPILTGDEELPIIRRRGPIPIALGGEDAPVVGAVGQRIALICSCPDRRDP